jgi:hypothetical protein
LSPILKKFLDLMQRRAGYFYPHESSHDSLSNRTMLSRIASPGVSAPVFAGEYHYLRLAFGLRNLPRSRPLQAVVAHGKTEKVPGATDMTATWRYLSRC